ncbi:MAG TPA: hypothetical protein VN083_04625, partial [Vicinamibacteria bacterium]|nr:hypothetical protein [Vicinamibacteria bacterium]
MAYALALSAVQWLPTVELLPSGSRLALPPPANMGWSVHPASLADLVVPNLVSGFSMDQGVRDLLFESREPFLSCLYLGVCAALVSMLGVVGGGRGGAWAAAAVGFLLIAALGPHTPLFRVLLHLPLVRLFRYPSKGLIPVGLVFGLLTSQGFEVWSRPWGERERRGAMVCVGVGVLLVLGAMVAAAVSVREGSFVRGLLDPQASVPVALETVARSLHRTALVAALAVALMGLRRFWEKPPWALGAALVALVLADVALVGRGVNPTAPRALARAVPPILRVLPLGSRLFVLQDPVPWLNRQLVRGPKGWPREAAWALGLQEMVFPLTAGRWGLYGSFEGDFTGLGPPALAEYSSLLTPGSPRFLRVLQAGAVDYVVALHDVFPGFEKIAEFQSVFAEPIRVFRVPEPLSRTYVVEGVRSVPES